ncbi:hypothetical protein CH063_12440 [Colletotrichum higginsianum]|uniref:Uncharacterized protein n=2 Tax=Colletotrichum higginsianum TaxID=80884 RepID=H1VQD4_COLHI|nr:hypothetical protein CH63R_04348 [Colletotrichum higginsianum IMI 349063]OBR12052.1 hypothetical protein CH63R_04348 [Colletotrichum higginsianum IMI 349063]TIC99129.1 hypothetical protein CH35J_005804 [Colletotrichum higginsianum]CCF42440.1 hypothetical protein CH063_12440 [Colletotrichum higginsianum]
MDSWGYGDLWTRANADGVTTGGGNGVGDSLRGPFKATSNSTSAIVNQFRFQAAKSIRTSTIILAVFNVVAAFATAIGIFWDGYATAKRNNQKFGFRTHGFTFVGPAESFPLILSVGIVVQGIVFAVAQSTGLDHLLTLGCTITSQMMLPAVFIVPYIQLVFALEVAFRSLRKNPLPPRSKWNVTICLAIVGTFLLATYLVTLFVRPPNFCFASLFWFVQRWKEGCFVLLTFISVALLASTLIIFFRLHNNAKIENSERVAASRMVYFLAVAFISTTLLVPFFFNLSFTEQRGATGQSLTLSMIASVVANVSGLMTGGLHLFLRSNTLSTIGPRQSGKWESDRKKLKAGIRVYNGDDEYENHMMNPVGQARSLRRMDSTDSLVPEKEEEARIESPSGSPTYANPLRSNAVWQPARSPVKTPEPAQVSTYQVPKAHARKRSYSLFPSEQQNNNTKSITLLPAKTYAPGARIPDEDEMMLLRPPPSMHPQGFRHRRDSSLASSATVQIGLRLSNVDDMPPLDSHYFQNNASVNSLSCPDDRDVEPSKRPSPLAQVDVASDSGSSDSEEDGTLVSSPIRREKDLRMRALPSVPRVTVPRQSQLQEQEPEQLTLSPAVYRPESPQKTRVTSPQGVGFNTPAQRKKAPIKCTKQNCQCSGQHDKRDWI